jgi:hypothetical protein
MKEPKRATDEDMDFTQDLKRSVMTVYRHLAEDER